MTTDSHASAIVNLEPSCVWRFFASLSAVPRPSKREQQIRAHVLKLAAQHKLAAREDAVGNIVIDVPATPGHEAAPITVLQAHVDMVCEKNAGVAHDFDADPIRLVIDKDDDGAAIVRADGTTLGADNGIGVALAFAAATEKDVVHGPLELLLTIDEEMGMTGANALSPESFKGRRLINLDSEEDDRIYIGCAGGCDVNLTWTLPLGRVAGGASCHRVTVSGLRGGHSGGNIHEGRGNANKILARALHHAAGSDLQLVTIFGGSKRNAIPREAMACVSGGGDLRDRLAAAANRVQEEAATESNEKRVAIRVEKVDLPDRAVSTSDTRRLLDALLAVPSGVLGMHPQVRLLVETSNNLSTLADESVEDGAAVRVVAGTLTRSSSESRMEETLAALAGIARLSGAAMTTANRYPGWSPKLDSPLLETVRSVYARRFEEEPEVAAIHAGLECGVIGRRVGEIDMVSFGPHIEGAHSPDERVWIDSVAKTWVFLKEVLANLAEEA